MTPDDPRHGTNRGYLAGCRDTCCKTAHADYRRDLRTRQYLNRGGLSIGVLGTHRRIQALMALGWATTDIDVVISRRPSYTANLLRRNDTTILKSTADLIALAYDEMSMALPATDTVARTQMATRTRNLAQRRGYAPPLAWDDIDDPAEQPTDWTYRPPTRVEILEGLIEDGAGLFQVLGTLGLSRGSFHAWCTRNGHSDTYLELVAAVNTHTNQYTQRSAS